ncbi:MAG: hypothetical protein JJU34_17820 [Lunatimonas sp.]|uniref:hypothetical protein n=1 Tax=Lunatimonas sp. TaxID=2060141 RepID=UPI00263B8525|nr:hypothetical protein [Lunatimonas sp.]MCC5939142.1 hypothetical protein [Lunatimonas sp.]
MKSLLIIVFYAVVIYAVNFYLIDLESLIFRQILEQGDLDIPEHVLLEGLDQLKYWSKFSLLFSVLIFVVKAFLVAALLYSGLFFANYHHNQPLSRLFNVAVYAESILVIAVLIKIMVISSGDFSYDAFMKYYPLSAISFFDYSTLHQIFVYPLQLVNAFELAYIVLLIYFLKEEVEIPFLRSSRIVVTSYGMGMFCWVILVMFFTLNMM